MANVVGADNAAADADADAAAPSPEAEPDVLVSWGYNKYGQLGHASRASLDGHISPIGVVSAGGASAEPFAITLPPPSAAAAAAAAAAAGVSEEGAGQRAPATHIAAGWVHCLAVDASGRCWGWGGNNNSTIGGAVVVEGTAGSGGGDARERPPPKNSVLRAPVRVPFPEDVRVSAVSCGMFHSLAIDSFGQAWSWGSGKFGKLGHGDEEPRFVPTIIGSFTVAQLKAAKIVAGEQHSFMVDGSGRAFEWGRSFPVAEGGHGAQATTVTKTSLPTPIRSFLKDDIVDIASTFYHALAVTSSGQAWAWGDNRFGQLGNGTHTSSRDPVKVLLPATAQAVAVAAGLRHSACICCTVPSAAHGDERCLYTWGSGAALGLGPTVTESPTPALVNPSPGRSWTRVRQIAAHNCHTLAVVDSDASGVSGNVFAWGLGSSGQLGQGDPLQTSEPSQGSQSIPDTGDSSKPQVITGLLPFLKPNCDIQSVAAGETFSLVGLGPRERAAVPGDSGLFDADKLHGARGDAEESDGDDDDDSDDSIDIDICAGCGGDKDSKCAIL